MQRTDQPKAAYHSDDRELLLGFYKWLLWRWMIPLIPRWITPNAITIFGAVCSVLAVVTSVLAATQGIPALYLVSGFLLLCYLTADNVDGAHARRTNRASAVGELLDHGFDGIASGTLLICGGIVLHLDAVPLSILVGVGSVAFALTMWEQYRTNLLVIPEVSGTEGVTLVFLLDVVAFAAGDPEWMHYDGSKLLSYSNGVLAIVFVGYVIAMVPPIVRSKKAGANPTEIVPIALIIALLTLYTQAGANPLYACIMMGLVASDVGARYIRLRCQEIDTGKPPWARLLIAVPLIPAFIADDPAVADACALGGIGLSLIFYAATMVRAARALSGISAGKKA